jgi:hypothetical protein
MIPLWKGKNPIYFGVITIVPFDNFKGSQSESRIYPSSHVEFHNGTKLIYNVMVTQVAALSRLDPIVLLRTRNVCITKYVTINNFFDNRVVSAR